MKFIDLSSMRRISARRILAATICLAALQFANGATLELKGSARFQVQSGGSLVLVSVDQVANLTTGGISGTLRLELWAFSRPYAGTSQSGYRTATATLGQLQGGSSFSNVSQTVTYQSPPAGAWFYSLLLTEYSTAVSGNDGFAGRDFINFNTTPQIQAQPQSQTIDVGQTVNFSVVAYGVPEPTYQWERNGTALDGATNPTLALGNVQSSDAGSYTVAVSNNSGTVTSNAGVLVVTASSVIKESRLTNLSVRSRAGTGEQTLTVGFVVAGTGSKQVLTRGIGPTLATFGVSGCLSDPQLKLFDAHGTLISQNDDWGGGATLTNAFASVGAFSLSANSKDAALYLPLTATASTAQVSSVTGTGIALVEAYDADAGNPSTRFINLSARNQVGVDTDTLLAGFVISGNARKTLLIRGIGPALAQFGVPGVLQDPQLTLFDAQSGVISENDDWGGGADLANTFASVGAFALPAGSKDSALLVTLDPGLYSAQIAGVNRTTGVGLVEVYDATDAAPNINLDTSGSGAVTANPAGPYTKGSVVTLTANPASGATFLGWSGDVSGTSLQIRVTLSRNLSIGAAFSGASDGLYTLTTTTAGSGQGTIARSPSAVSYAAGTVVTLTATAAAGSTFTGWSGDISGASPTAQVTMTGNLAVVATFDESSTLSGISSSLRVMVGNGFDGSYDPYGRNSVVNGRTLMADGGSPLSGYTWTVSSGSVLPTGVGLQPFGLITYNGGTVVPGNYTFNITVSDGSRTATGNVTFTARTESTEPDRNGIPGVQSAAVFQQLTTSSFTLVSGRKGLAYGATVFVILGGAGNRVGTTTPLPLSWSVASGYSLPPGLTLDASRGVIRGTPSATGTYSFKIVVRDNNGTLAVGSPTYIITIN